MPTERVDILPMGMILDQPPEIVPPGFWTDAENVTFSHGTTERVRGAGEVWSAVVNPDHVAPTPTDAGNVYWTWASQTAITVTDGATNFDITPAGGISAVSGNVWSFDILNGINVINQGQGLPLYWDGNTGNAALPLPDFPAGSTCVALRAYKFHLVALNLGGAAGFDQSYLRWSDAAAPGTIPQSWTIGTGSEAGDNVLGDEPGPLVDARRLRDSLYIYKENAVYSMDYIGGAEVMGFRQVFGDVGAMALNCVADWSGQHVVLTKDDVIIHDGQSWRSLIDDLNRRTLFTSLNVAARGNCYLCTVEHDDEVWICIPTAANTYPDTAYVWHSDSDTWSIRDLPGIRYVNYGNMPAAADENDPGNWDEQTLDWATIDRPWNTRVITVTDQGAVGVTASKALAFGATVEFDGAAIRTRIRHESHDFGAPELVKMVKRVIPRVHAADGTGFTVRVGSQMSLSDDVAWSVFTFLKGGSRWVDCMVAGRYLSFEFESSFNADWRISGFQVELEPRSLY
jgi:hypothetical protein